MDLTTVDNVTVTESVGIIDYYGSLYWGREFNVTFETIFKTHYEGIVDFQILVKDNPKITFQFMLKDFLHELYLDQHETADIQ